MILFGLGNPEPEYDNTYHNIGWEVIRQLAYNNMTRLKQYGPTTLTTLIPGHITLAIAHTGMNESGHGVHELLSTAGLFDDTRLCVIHDDLSLPLGKIRYKHGGGSSGGHRGIESIEQELGSRDFARLKIGIGRPPLGEPFTPYVLAPRSHEHIQELASYAIHYIHDHAQLFYDT